jgi:TolB-like protein
VYRAHDLALGRRVAIKMLPQSFSAALRGTLLREADACARLQHPAVATYFESGEAGGLAYIAMELVDGRTLLDRLSAGPLPVDEAVAIAHCILEALVHAHSAGILHCDIKPANVVLTGRRSAKLLDFGLARHLFTSSPDALTCEVSARATIAGTVGYMSPEQVLSEPLDARSDVFQVGVALYEMLTGTPAFPGATALARLAAVVSKDPPAIAAPGVPPELAALVGRALARRPEARYPTAAAMLRDLIAIGSEDWQPNLPGTLAILDFDDHSDQGGSEWFGSGLADWLGADLIRSSISIVPRDAVLKSRARLSAVDAESRAVELGLSLGCRWVLTGDYQKQGDAIRITARIVEAAPGIVIASESLGGPMPELFAMHDRIARFVTTTLNLTGPMAPRTRPALSAYECYARGQRLFKKLEKGSMDQGLAFFERAVELDARCAPALTGLASVYAMRFTYTTDPSVLDRAASYAQRAIEADPGCAEAHVWLGYALWRLHRLADGDVEMRRARELDSSLFWGFYFGAALTHLLGRSEEALALSLRAVELEPKAAYTWYGLASLHLDLGNLSEALWAYERARHVNALPDASPFPDVGAYMAECHRRAGRLDEARALCLDSLERIERSDHMYRDSFRVFALIVLGAVALDQSDPTAAQAAFTQAIAHVKGRPRTLAGGWLVVRALAGLARSGNAAGSFDEARARLDSRAEFDFSWLWQCDESNARLDVDHAAKHLNALPQAPSPEPRGAEL